MQPKRIILARHGRSEANEDTSLYSRVPDYKIALVEQGREEARTAGRHVAELIGEESFGVYVSPYLRTMQTKECILTQIWHAPLFDYQDPCLREQDTGNLPGVLEAASNREARGQYGAFFYRFPNGESCADVYDRMSGFMNSLYRLFERPECPENLLIVTHSVAMRCFLSRWYHWTVEYFDSLPALPNCHLVAMGRDENGKYELTEPFAETPLLSQGVIDFNPGTPEVDPSMERFDKYPYHRDEED